jgi:thiosulfate reductase cytochrome b subunit
LETGDWFFVAFGCIFAAIGVVTLRWYRRIAEWYENALREDTRYNRHVKSFWRDGSLLSPASRIQAAVIGVIAIGLGCTFVFIGLFVKPR